MRCRVLSPLGDYSFGNNEQDYIGDVEAVAQVVKTKVLLFFGEWFENTGIGIPMFQSIVGQMNPEAIKMSATLLITQRIMEVEQVESVDNVEVIIDHNTREMRFVIDITTTLGSTTVEVK